MAGVPVVLRGPRMLADGSEQLGYKVYEGKFSLAFPSATRWIENVHRLCGSIKEQAVLYGR